MYLLFRHHDITPGQYYQMGYGEQKVIHAFMLYEIEERMEEIREAKGRK